MKRIFVIVALLVAAVAYGAQLTVQEVITAHRAGAAAEGLIALVQSAESVAQISTQDIAAMRTAGVPESVIQAMIARAPQPTPTPIPAQPDNPTLVDLVRLVKSGLSEKIIADQIRQNGVDAKPTINDLVYLKENGIQEVIIVALMEAPLKAEAEATRRAEVAVTIEPTPTPTPEPEPIFEGLVYKTGGIFAKNRTGKLVLEDKKLQWRDGSDASKNFELFIEGVKQITVTCQARETGSFCYQLQFDFTKGDDYDFEDAQRDVGGNENVMRLLNVLKAKFPKLQVVEKTKS